MDKMKIKEKIGEKIDGLIEQGITSSNLDALDKLIDMMKDVHEIEKIEKEGGQSMYKEGGYVARGNYREGGYGAGYSEGYSEGREEYSRGNYGAQSTTMKSLEFMMQSVVEFIKMLEKEASSQEEVKLIKEYTKKISEM